MNRRDTVATLTAIISSLVLVSCQNDAASMLPPFVGQSGHSFPLGEERVIIDYGYIDDGDKLVYAIIRTWPDDTSAETILDDPRCDFNSGILPRIQHPDGQMREVATNGTIYMFFGDQLRTMRVEMDEHTDTVGISQQKDTEGIWNYLTQFQVAKE